MKESFLVAHALSTASDREWFSAGEGAKVGRTSRRRIYRAVRTKQFTAAVINDRGEFHNDRDGLRDWLTKLAGRA